MKRILLLAAALAAAWTAAAKITLPEIIGDNMVLQQNADVKLWGWADPHTAVKVDASWGARATAKSGGDGRWEVMLKTPAGGYEPQRITIAGDGKVELNDVLIGEVWFAAGQSNMEMGVLGFHNCPVARSNEVIARADAWRGKVRYVKIPKTASYTPEERVAGRWNEFSTETAPLCTAVGYFFAEMLNDVLGVPVGVIDCSWGGSRVESWSSRELLETYPDIDITEKGIVATDEWLRPLVMYNGMLHPVAGYTVRGYLWYQGESNVGAHAVYPERLANMVKLWRGLWGQGELPFYFVEIAPFNYWGSDLSAFLREAQCRAQDVIPNSGMVSTNDLVEPYEWCNIHPANKHDIGYRLAYMALNRTYGKKTVHCDSPRFRSAEIADGKVVVSLDNAEYGFNRLTGIEGFELCGSDGVFCPADVAVDAQMRLVVSSKEVPEPTAVRYCFRNFQIGNLANSWGLPVIPFRTDDYPPRP